VIGAAIDGANAILMYPFREWVFLGAFKYANPWDESWHPLPTTHDMGEVTLGIAISGGGSRSAYFATCVLDELGRHNIPGTTKTYLDEVDFVSGVSGGSLAATYYCANRHRRGFPAGHEGFFDRMREDLSANFELGITGRFFLGSFALIQFTYYDLWHILSAVWDARFFDDLTFGDLDPSGPALLVNAVCYDNGEKFVFSRVPIASREPPHIRELVGRSHKRSWTGGAKFGATMSFETIHSSIAPCPLSTAVGTSSAVPPLLGPIVLRDHGKEEDVHLGDGGIYDNHGYESLLQAMLPEVRAHPDRPVILLVIDGAGFFESSASAGALNSSAEYLERVTAIAWLRMAGYEDLAYDLAEDESIRRGRDYPLRAVVTETISLYDEEVLAAVKSPGEHDSIVKRLRSVPTRFSLNDDAREAIDVAAPALTRAALVRLEDELRERQRLLAEADRRRNGTKRQAPP
jgi:predicted acylesterase/phospholipase RssA